jgi:hypothetical protein
MWSIDLKDFAAEDPEEIRCAATLNPVHAGDIVLYHGLSEAAASGLSHVLETAAANGKRLVAVSTLAGLAR